MNLHQFPTVAGSCTKPCAGYRVEILGPNNEVLKPESLGNVCIRLPMPPAFMLTLWGNDEAFIEKYLAPAKGYYTTGDAGYFDRNGYLHIMTRVDDVINTAGHRLSTGRIEEVINEHDDIVESAVVALNDPIKGECPFAFVIPKASSKKETKVLESEVNAKVRADIGAIAKLYGVVVLGKLPKTRSGKILRGTIRKIVNNAEFAMPATIEDASVLDTIQDMFKEWKSLNM